MNDFLNNNKQLFFSIFFAIGVLAVIFFLGNKLSHFAFNQANQLSQIIAVETELLKQWQQSNGLKNTLAYNTNGSEVTLLQRMLSQDESVYPERKITGYYGDLTKNAVTRFQSEYNLPQTGVVDTTTRNKLNEVFLSHLCPEQTTIYPDLSKRKVTRDSLLPKSYTPSNLENISDEIKTIGIACVHEDLVENLKAMFSDAENEDVHLAVTSGYRKPDIQKYLYDFWLDIEGTSALDEIAEPGASEHQLGTTVDLTDASIKYAGVDDRFADSKGGKWLQQNAHKYGFIMSYPEDKKDITGYEFEPWHWRFVGTDVATKLYDRELTFNEYSLNKQKPYPKENIVTGVDLSANAILSIFVDRNGTEYTLLKKNKKMRLPIANLTRLMTALVASDIFRPDDVVTISDNAMEDADASKDYVSGDNLYFDDALHALLIGLNNEIAVSMAEQIGTDKFIQRMNKKAQTLDLEDTHFMNVSGIDPEVGSEEINYSTPADLAKLLRYIFENREDIFSILEKSEYKFTDVHGVKEITVEKTNDIIKNQNLALKVLGSLTEETSIAKMNLVTVSDSPSRGRIISIVIGSEDSFRDMRKLLKYVKNSFSW